MKLEDALNIGKVLSNKLREAEISNLDILKTIGAEQAFTRIITIDVGAGCYQMLCALEGVVQGIRWHHLGKERKRELKEFYNFVSKGAKRGEN